MTETPSFSVIVVDYEGAVTRDQFRRKMASLAAQTCQDFEVLVYHDGPKTTTYEEDVANSPCPANVRFFVTEERENNWGHGNRHRGIYAAKGNWIVHTNADNVFYPRLIETLKMASVARAPVRLMRKRNLPIGVKSIGKRVDRAFGTNFLGVETIEFTERQALVFAVIMRGLAPFGDGFGRLSGDSGEQGIVFGGIPIRSGNIDLMQFVMRRDLWLAEGGWSDLSENSDGFLYKRFAKKYHVVVVPEILGEHW